MSNEWQQGPGGTRQRDVVRGRIVEIPQNFNNLGAPTGLQTDPRTVIDWQLPHMGVWNLTLLPYTFRPGAASWNGRQNQDTQVFTTAPLQAFYNLTWGAGGATFNTEGYWPTFGRSMTIAADIVRLDVRAFSGALFVLGTTTPVSLVIGAWLVPAVGTNPFWTEQQEFVGNVQNQLVPVPWGARFVHIRVPPQPPTVDMLFRWWGINDAPLGIDINVNAFSTATCCPGAVTIPVPADARALVVPGSVEVPLTAALTWECVLG